MIKRTLSCLLALSLWTVAPSPAEAAVPVAVEFQPNRQALVLQLPAGVVPSTLELNNPPRFVVDLPGTYPVRAESFTYPQGLVTGVTVARRGDTTRVVLRLRRPLNGAYSATLEGGRLVFVLPGGGAPVQPADTPRPVTTPTPKPQATPTPRPTPKPTPRVTPKPKPTVRPTAKPTARPTARPSVLPSPRPIPSIAPSPVPTLPPPQATPSPVQVLPSPLPMPADDTPMILPTPSGEVPMVLPTPAGEAPRVLPTPGAAATPTPKPTPRPTAKPSPKPTPKPAATPARPAQAAPAVKVGRIAYDEDTRFLTIGLSGKVTPRFTMEEAPPRLVIELPGAAIAAPQNLTYPDALVTSVSAAQANPTTTRITLTFARPVGQNWAQRATASSLVLIFDRRPVQE